MERTVTVKRASIGYVDCLRPEQPVGAAVVRVQDETVRTDADLEAHRLRDQQLKALALRPPQAEVSSFWTRQPEVRDQAVALASRGRLWVQDPGHDTLRPAQPTDVYNSFAAERGTLYVVTRRGQQGTLQSEQRRADSRHDGFFDHSYAHSASGSTNASVVMGYSAVPIDDVDLFLSFRQQDSKGRDILGLPGVVGLSPRGGEVQVGQASESHSSASGGASHDGFISRWQSNWSEASATWARHGILSQSGSDPLALPRA